MKNKYKTAKEIVLDILFFLVIVLVLLWFIIGMEVSYEVIIFLLVVILLLQYLKNEKDKYRLDILNKNVSNSLIKIYGNINTLYYKIQKEYLLPGEIKNLDDAHCNICEFIINNPFPNAQQEIYDFSKNINTIINIFLIALNRQNDK